MDTHLTRVPIVDPAIIFLSLGQLWWYGRSFLKTSRKLLVDVPKLDFFCIDGNILKHENKTACLAFLKNLTADNCLHLFLTASCWR